MAIDKETRALVVGGAIAVLAGLVAVAAWNRVPTWTQIVLVSLAGVGILVAAFVAIASLEPPSRGERSGREGGPRLLLYASLSLVAIAGIYVGAVLLLDTAGIELPEISLPLLLLLGLAALLLTVAIVAVVFSRYRMSDRSAALALPEGSVQAIIALSLILIFAIMSTFLYATLLRGDVKTSRGLTQEQIATLPQENIVSVRNTGEEDEAGNALYDVELRVQANDASQEFSKQLLTTISTLVVAIAAFYFGSKATSAALPMEGPGLRILSPTSPAQPPATGEKLTITLEVSPRGSVVKGDVFHGGGELTPARAGEYSVWEWTRPPALPEGAVLMFSLPAYPEIEHALRVTSG